MKYAIYFRFFKKKMKATIEADSREQAEYILRGKIKVDKIEREELNPSVEHLKNVFGMN